MTGWRGRRSGAGGIGLATKAAGPARDGVRPSHVRGGRTSFTRANLLEAVDGSLRRLRTDCIDLDQLHWPDRSTNSFGKLGFEPVKDEETVPVEERSRRSLSS